MKTIGKIIIVLLILFLGVSLAAYIFINTKGKDLIVAQLDNVLQPQVDIESVKLIFPTTLQMQGIDIEDFLTAEELVIQPSLLTLLTGNIGFSKIAVIEPDITITRASDGSFNVTSLLKLPKSGGKAKPVVIGELSVKNGVINFIDRKVESGGFSTKVTDFNMKVRNPLNPRFKISAEMQGGTFRTSGWVNLLRKDMDANLELSNINGAYFSPYFKKFLSGRKLKSADLNSQVSLSAKNNEVEGICQLEISNIAYEEPPEEEVSQEEKEDSFPSPAALIFGSEGSLPKNISMDLPIKGTLIPFRIKLVKIAGSVFSEMLKQTISGDPEKLPEKIEDIGEQFKAFGKEIEKVFKKETETQE